MLFSSTPPWHTSNIYNNLSNHIPCTIDFLFVFHRVKNRHVYAFNFLCFQDSYFTKSEIKDIYVLLWNGCTTAKITCTTDGVQCSSVQVSRRLGWWQLRHPDSVHRWLVLQWGNVQPQPRARQGASLPVSYCTGLLRVDQDEPSLSMIVFVDNEITNKWIGIEKKVSE